MKYLARTATGDPLLGDEDGYVPLTSVHPGLDSVRGALPRAASGTLGSPDDATAARTGESKLTFGAPLERFGKLWGIGLNYVEHAGDLDEDGPDEPASFFKPRSALTAPGGPIRLPPPSETERVTAEGELGVVLGRTCRDASEPDVDDVVAGYLPVIDMTAEDVLRRNPRLLTRAKSYDTFLVAGHAIAVPDEAFELDSLTVATRHNGAERAANRVGNMLFSPRELVAVHSRVATLEPGDLFSTGTPGAAHVEPGDTVEAVVESVGSVSAPVVRE